MKYRVEIPATVHDAIADCVSSLCERGAPLLRVEAWLDRLVSRIESLETMPRRHPISQANSELLGYPVHRMIHEDHAIFYRVDDRERVVRLLAFRDGRRRPWEDE